MKLLIVTGIFPPDIGGPATYVSRIGRGLAERGHEVTVVTLSDRLDHDDAQHCFRVVRLRRRMFKPARMLMTMCRLLRLGWRADVLLVNGLALETVIANKVLRKPLIMKVVGDLAWERATALGWTGDGFEAFQEKRYGLRIESLKLLRAWWTRQAHSVIVPSRYLAGCVQRWGVPGERIAVIYNSVELPEGIEPLPVPLSTPLKAVTVGRLVPWKRVDRILDAVAQVRDLGLIVVGDGPERPRLEHRAALLGIGERVYFAGRRSLGEALGLMAGCDLFVLNSTYEGLPHVVLEAMALGLPVVATAAGGTPEAVRDGETGFLIPCDGPSLKSAIVRLLDVSYRIRLSTSARDWTLAHFRSDVMIEETERVLVRRLNGGSR